RSGDQLIGGQHRWREQRLFRGATRSLLASAFQLRPVMRTIMIDTYVGRTQMMLRRSATALALTMIAACSRETLLEVETPDQIRPGDAANPAGAQALRAAAIGNFSNFYGGTINVGANLYGGLVSDELINA